MAKVTGRNTNTCNFRLTIIEWNFNESSSGTVKTEVNFSIRFKTIYKAAISISFTSWLQKKFQRLLIEVKS